MQQPTGNALGLSGLNSAACKAARFFLAGFAEIAVTHMSLKMLLMTESFPSKGEQCR